MRKFLPFILLVIECERASRRKKVFIWRFLIHNRLIICVYLAFFDSQLVFLSIIISIDCNTLLRLSVIQQTPALAKGSKW